MICVGIDQSFNSTGLVALEISSNLIAQFRVLNKAHKQYGMGDVYDKVNLVTTDIIQFCLDVNATQVAIEGLAFGMRGNATRDLGGLLYHIVIELRKHKLDPMIVAPTSLKKYATNNGRATKPDMHNALPTDIKDMFKQYKKTTGLYDLTDAYWLAQYSSCHGTTNS